MCLIKGELGNKKKWIRFQTALKETMWMQSMLGGKVLDFWHVKSKNINSEIFLYAFRIGNVE